MSLKKVEFVAYQGIFLRKMSTEYLIETGECWFVGIKNARENIVRAIAQAEGVSRYSLAFVELQVQSEYPQIPPGVYQAIRFLIYKPLAARLYESRWFRWTKRFLHYDPAIKFWYQRETAGSRFVEHAFKDRIGKLPEALRPVIVAEAQEKGYKYPTGVHSDDLAELQKFIHIHNLQGAQIIVDYGATPERLKTTGGNQYCLWTRIGTKETVQEA